MICPECLQGFELKRASRTSEPTCSPKCRAARSRKRQRREIEEAFTVLQKALKIGEEKSLEH